MTQLLDYRDEYLKERVRCLENERRELINCLKVTLTLLVGDTSNKEARHYLEKVLEREGEKDV